MVTNCVIHHTDIYPVDDTVNLGPKQQTTRAKNLGHLIIVNLQKVAYTLQPGLARGQIAPLLNSTFKFLSV